MKKHPRILVLNGPNLNMLGVRERSIYGSFTLSDVESLCRKAGKELGLTVDCHQSNLEGELVTWIQKSRKTHQGIVLNAGGYSHTSVAILDALKLAKLPVMEVHISNIFAREPFRHHSLISSVATGVICGLGLEGYAHALLHIAGLRAPSRRKKS